MTWYNYTNQETLNDLECNEPSTRRIRTPPRTRRSLLVDRETIIIVVPRSRHTRKAYLKLDNELHWPLQNVTLYIHTFPRLVKITSITSRIIVSGEEITVIRTLSSTRRSDVNRDEGNRRYRRAVYSTREDSISKEGWHTLNWLLSSSIGLPGAGEFPLRHFPCAHPPPLRVPPRETHTTDIYVSPSSLPIPSATLSLVFLPRHREDSWNSGIPRVRGSTSPLTEREIFF